MYFDTLGRTEPGWWIRAPSAQIETNTARDEHNRVSQPRRSGPFSLKGCLLSALRGREKEKVGTSILVEPKVDNTRYKL